jgi:hypothetical protein
LPRGALTRWSLSFPILAFVDGLAAGLRTGRAAVGDRVDVSEAEEVETFASRPVAVADPPETVKVRS